MILIILVDLITFSAGMKRNAVGRGEFTSRRRSSARSATREAIWLIQFKREQQPHAAHLAQPQFFRETSELRREVIAVFLPAPRMPVATPPLLQHSPRPS